MEDDCKYLVAMLIQSQQRVIFSQYFTLSSFPRSRLSPVECGDSCFSVGSESTSGRRCQKPAEVLKGNSLNYF